MPGTQKALRNKAAQNSRFSGEASPSVSTSGRNALGFGVAPFASLVLLAIVVIGLYSPLRRHAFVNYDDGDYVVQNTHVRSGLNQETILWALTTTATGNWHPLTWFSHALDCQLFGRDPSGHHLTGLGLHVLNVLLLAWLLNTVTGRPWRSLLVAALFALHPLNVESVAWLAERKNLLSTLFLLLSIAAYARYVRNPAWGRYIAVAVFFLLGLASKPMVVTLPFVLLLADYWPLCRVEGWSALSATYPVRQQPLSRCAREKVPLLVMSAASSVITVIAQRSGGAVKSFDAFSFTARLENAVYSYVEYLSKTIIPWHLAAFYPHPGASLTSWKIALCVLLLLGVSGIAWRARRRAPYLMVGWLWFLGTLVPVIGLVQVGAQGMADRYAYVPLIGIFIAAVWGVADLCAHYRVEPVWSVSAAGLVLLAFSWMTSRQISYWQDSYTLWSHALAVTPDNTVSETQMGMALLEINRQDEAMQRFQRAIALGTHDPTSYLNLGSYLSQHGRYRDAIPFLETASHMNKDVQNAVLANLNLGFAYTSLGEYDTAGTHYRVALQLDPDRVLETTEQLAQFVAAHPSARDYLKLALLLGEAGRHNDAADALERAAQLDPTLRANPGPLSGIANTR